MRKLRTCSANDLNTGISKCPVDFSKMKGAIIVPFGTKLPSDLTADKLEELVHSDLVTRVYGIVDFREYAKEGGEAQVSAVGYGPEEVTGYSARKDTFTLDKFYPELNASLVCAGNRRWGAYFFDEDNFLYGMKDETDVLAPFNFACIYPNVTPHPTSSGKSTMTVTFSFLDAKESYTRFDYVKLDFNPMNIECLGLTEVVFKKTSENGNSYKLYEKVGGYDVTSIYGPLIAAAGNAVISGATTAATYDEESRTLTISADEGSTVGLKSPKVLYDNDIKGIEAV